MEKHTQHYECPHCHTVKKPQGFHNHVKACPMRGPKAAANKFIYQQLINEEIATSHKGEPQKSQAVPLWKQQAAMPDTSFRLGHREFQLDSDSQLPMPRSSLEIAVEALSTPSTPRQEKDDIKVEYHPHSERPTRIAHFGDFRRREPTSGIPKAHRAQPWKPFKSRSDFEFAQLALESNLNRGQVEQLIKIIKRCANGEDEFSISSNGDLRDRWAESAKSYSQFEKHVITADYREEKTTFSFWCLDLWDWALDLLQNESLAPHFEWDAQRLFKYDGKEFIRFIDEPWTANEWYEFQSSLPTTGKPLVFILFADKAKLSSFGTQMGYPIIARLANLPIEMRNGKGLGGGCVVGWLPDVKENEAGRNDKEYVDFKRVIWHESVRVLLQKLKTRTTSGEQVHLGDGQDVHLFPFIIWSSDYEEMVVMTLIRGHAGLFPCPICLVPSNCQHHLLSKYELRTKQKSMQLVRKACLQDPSTCEEMLKAVSLRPVENAFWDLDNVDLHRALGFDRMHNNAHGLGGKHLWPLIQKYLKKLGKNAEGLVDNRAMDLPRWRNLYHFKKITNVQFSDASKLEDLMKIVLFLVHDLFSSHDEPGIQSFLLLVRKYMNIDMYTSFNVHTTQTLEALKNEIHEYNDILNEYMIESKDVSTKNWDFPKNHMLSHIVDGIFAKGVTLNTNTQSSESMHGFIRDVYHQRTNFKDIAPQILEVATCVRVANLMNSGIEPDEEEDANDAALLEGNKDGSKNCPIFHQIQLGSKQKIRSLLEFENNHQNEGAFHGFAKRVTHFVKEMHSANICYEDKITEWAFMKVKYESMVDWRVQKDYLRCSPAFHGRARHDYIMFQSESGPAFAQLHMIFTIMVHDQAVPLCLVAIFPQLDISSTDKDLEFIRLHQEHQFQIIYARSIIRGTMLLPAFDHRKDFLVFDVVDADMFLRVRTADLHS